MKSEEEVKKRMKIVEKEFSEEEKKLHEGLEYCNTLIEKINELRWCIDLPALGHMKLR